jgi:hypothetical protein
MFFPQKDYFENSNVFMINIIIVEAAHLLLICAKYIIANFLNYHFDNAILWSFMHKSWLKKNSTWESFSKMSRLVYVKKP